MFENIVVHLEIGASGMDVTAMMRAINELCGKGAGIFLSSDGYWFVGTGDSRISVYHPGKGDVHSTYPRPRGSSPDSAILAWWETMVEMVDKDSAICRVQGGRETMLRWGGISWQAVPEYAVV